MSDNIRIKTTPGGSDKKVNINVKQKFDFIEILSLKISQDEAYRRFCSDYGVIVGRVIVNNGVGVPNAKVSVFIPIDEVDLEDPEVFGLYPFELITDKDGKGIPYNLLPRNNRGKDACFTPVGTFPSKREIQDNPDVGEIYCQYYKFTTTTNDSGDYMFFGVPVGTHFLHADADISDIGRLSQKPYDLIRDGATKESFQSTTKFKGRAEASVLPQLKTFSPMSVTVPPFWGDTEECDIGIARRDIDLATTITPAAIFMGSLVSDNDKHAVSRRCTPRKKLGKMDEVVTGEGRIEMIRKTNDGNTERFDVEGGEVIDGDGVWAYQIPMNSSYMVTSEDGSFVPSNDPSKGIATKTNVRFRIGMTTYGDEGRNRTRAKYLVPHNPDVWNGSATKKGVDFSFDSTTKDENFSELSWNKIYTVKNHITRVQARGGAENRNFIGFKNVDDSATSNPIPFNKLDNDVNVLYTIICLIITIIASLVAAINLVVINLLNIVISAINFVLGFICTIVYNFVGKGICALKFSPNKNCWKKYCISDEFDNDGICDCASVIPYIPFVVVTCSTGDFDTYYTPGGYEKGYPFSFGYDAAAKQKNPEFPDDKDKIIYREIIPATTTPWKPFAGWVECVSLGIADALDLFKFDFYNDWINGTLYPFLLKYKVKKKGFGKEKFCEADCRDYTGGVDNDKDGDGDNRCYHNRVVDTCTGAGPQFGAGSTFTKTGVNTDDFIKFKGGYIKKYENELYYAPILRANNHKLFATDIVSLGSVFDCDWEGTPKFHHYLTDTTFNIPPLIRETLTTGSYSEGKVVTTGFDTAEVPDTLIGNISCLGLSTDSNNCNNIKRLCELGIGLDEDRTEKIQVPPGSGIFTTVNSPVDNKILNNDVDHDYIRGIFAYLNTPGASVINEIKLDSGLGTSQQYDYKDPHYSAFRGRTIVNAEDEKIWVYENSFYFYFGLNKGKSALSRMRTKYFPECIPEVDVDFFITGVVEPDSAGTGAGSITTTVTGGIGPFTYLWSGGPTIGTTTYPVNKTTANATGLYAGTYTLTITDDVGNVTNTTFIVSGPPNVECDIQSKNVTKFGNLDGEIIVTISSGSGPYIIAVSDYDSTTGLVSGTPTIINPAPAGTTVVGGKGKGEYLVVVTDSGTPTTSCSQEVTLTEPKLLTLSLTETPITCFGADDGELKGVPDGGDAPYDYLWSPGGQMTTTRGGLTNGVSYSLTVTDVNGNTVTQSKTLAQPSQITVGSVTAVDKCNGTTPAVYVSGIAGGTPGTTGYSVRLRGGEDSTDITNTLSLGVTSTSFIGVGNAMDSDAYDVIISDENGCSITVSQEVFVPASALGGSTSIDISSLPPTLTVNASGGIFENNPTMPTQYGYRAILQSSLTGSAPWTNVTNLNLGTSTSGTYTLPLTPTVDTWFRYEIKDKNGASGHCIHNTNIVKYSI